MTNDALTASPATIEVPAFADFTAEALRRMGAPRTELPMAYCPPSDDLTREMPAFRAGAVL